MSLAFITWTADPVAFTIPFIDKDVRWYGLAFALGFLIGIWIVSKIWKHEKLKEDWFDKLFVYVFVATVVGARLGHCLLYNPQHYLANPIEIFKIWEGGLASHGGTLGILIAVWIYSKKVTHKNMLWTLDRLVVPVGFVAALIRIANLMNHEIYGHATNVAWAFRFITNIPQWEHGAAPIFSEPSHPTQIYEAICYILTSCICMWLYWKKEAYKKQGLIFGVFFIGIFLSRFIIEFYKNDQEAFEAGWILNMGQLLSIPFIAVGFWFMIRALIKKENKGVAKSKK